MAKTSQPRPVFIARPPKPVSKMTDEELRAWCEQVGDAMADKMRRR